MVYSEEPGHQGEEEDAEGSAGGSCRVKERHQRYCI